MVITQVLKIRSMITPSERMETLGAAHAMMTAPIVGALVPIVARK
jgi:hypothetical protein